MYLGDIDLSETPDAMPPLPLGGVHRKWLRRFVIGALAKAGCTRKILLSYYTETKVVWEIPALHSPNMGKEGLYVRPSMGNKRKIIDIHKVLLSTLTAIRLYGVTNETLASLAATCGDIVLHPMTFSRETEDLEKAEAVFSMEAAVFFQGISANFKIGGDTAAFKLARHWKVPYIGVIGGMCEGKPVSQALMQETLHFSRGTVQFTTYDMYDRLYNWVGEHYTLFENAEYILKALALLKFTQDRSDYYDLEQEIVAMKPFEGQVLTMRADLYTDAAFDLIRDEWLKVDTPIADRAKILHRLLVPYYLDGMQFNKLFGGDPTKEEKPKNYDSKVVAGMDTFTTMFLDTQKHIKEGRFVGMELE